MQGKNYPQHKKLSTMKKMDFMWKNNLFTELSTLSTMDRLWMNCEKAKYMFC